MGLSSSSRAALPLPSPGAPTRSPSPSSSRCCLPPSPGRRGAGRREARVVPAPPLWQWVAVVDHQPVVVLVAVSAAAQEAHHPHEVLTAEGREHHGAWLFGPATASPSDSTTAGVHEQQPTGDDLFNCLPGARTGSPWASRRPPGKVESPIGTKRCRRIETGITLPVPSLSRILSIPYPY